MKSLKRILYLTILLGLLFFAVFSYAEENIVKSKYFSIEFYDGCETAKLAEKLKADRLLHIDLVTEDYNSSDMNEIIANLFDSLYLEVCDILDIHMYDFQGTIKIVPTKNDISEIIFGYIGKRPANMPSFYCFQDNMLYISGDSLNIGMLAHEMGHVIISRYFIVPPSEKVQEILCGYVEYSIMKKTGTLPTKTKK